MKKHILLFVATIFLANTHVLSAEKKTSFFKPWNNKDISKDVSTGETLKKKEKFLKPWNRKKISKNDSSIIDKKNKSLTQKTTTNDIEQNISVYTGTFDTVDKEGDDKTTLVGVEHKNKNLFRNTWLGRFSPTTGGFITGKSSIYLYTGIEAEYNLGPINISPSFAPGYYEAGDGKNLGSALEFKSEVKIGVDLFKNSNVGYSYSHISNND